MRRYPTSSSRSTRSLGSELRAASRRELATLKRDLKDKHRDRMKRIRTKEASSRRKKLVMAAAETTGAAAAAGMARSYLGDKMDVGPVPLELPAAIAGHLVGGYFYPDDEKGEHVHNVSNGLMAVAAFQGSQRITAWARERARRSAAPAPAATAGALPPGDYGYALPPPPSSLALPPPPAPPPPQYAPAPHATAGAPVPTSFDRAMDQALRVMEEARQG